MTRFSTLPIEYRGDFNDNWQGGTKSQVTLDNAILPFVLADRVALVLRTKLPYEWRPPKNPGDSFARGLANGYTEVFFGPADGQDVYWGAGPVVGWPASNQALGSTQLSLGPAVAAYRKSDDPLVYGIVAQNLWSTGSTAGGNGKNELQVNPIVAYELGEGWAIGSSPVIKADWLAKTGQQWTVPVGASLTKVTRLDDQPVQFGVAAYYNAVRPQASEDTWFVQLSVKFLFPAPH